MNNEAEDRSGGSPFPPGTMLHEVHPIEDIGHGCEVPPPKFSGEPVRQQCGVYYAGAQMIANERARQIHTEGFLADHDDGHTGGELADAGACYADFAAAQARGVPAEKLKAEQWTGAAWPSWPWDEDSFNPKEDAVRNLVRAGALIAAEIDRVLRKRELEQKGNQGSKEG